MEGVSRPQRLNLLVLKVEQVLFDDSRPRLEIGRLEVLHKRFLLLDFDGHSLTHLTADGNVVYNGLCQSGRVEEFVRVKSCLMV